MRMTSSAERRRWVLAALDQYERRLVRYAQRLLGDDHESHDVVQFAFLRLCEQTPDKIGDVLAQWLYTVCHNRAMDVLRARRGDRHKLLGGNECCDESSHETEILSREINPSDSAEQVELYALVRELILELPASQREAIDLWADGFHYRQIASIIDREEGHVRVLVHRGLKAIREHPRVRPLLSQAGGVGEGVGAGAKG
jgi:RNA polymerase sigma-70 factor (ECF subfamily)